MLTLGATFEGLELLRNRVVDRLVIAALEVEQRYVFHRAPIAPVQGVRVAHEQRSRDRLSLALCQHHDDVFGQRGTEAQEELEVEVRRRAMRGVGAAVAAVEELPVFSGDRLALEPAERNARVTHAAALLADVLAPLVRKAREEVVEACVALVLPVELHRAAH